MLPGSTSRGLDGALGPAHDHVMDLQARALSAVPRMRTLPKPELLQLLCLLPLRTDQLADLIGAAVRENPMLQRGPGGPCIGCGRHSTQLRCRTCARSPPCVDLPSTTDWRAELASAVRMELPAHLHDVVELVVGSLDDRGMLDPGLLHTASPVPVEAWRSVVAALREVGPPGIAATSPTEAVQVQAAQLVALGRCVPLLLPIVEDYLPDVAAGDLARVADRLGTSLTAVEEAVDQLRALVRPVVASTRRPLRPSSRM